MKSLLLLALLALTLAAQQNTAQQNTADTENPFSADARLHYNFIKPSVLRAAEKMPEEFYSFKTMNEARTYGEMIAHIADAQIRMCGVVKGESPTADARNKKTKAELIAVLKASFDYCDPVYASMTDKAAAGPVRWAIWNMSKLGLLNWNISHDNEMYGQLAVFLRIKGLVPPASEGRP